MDIITLTIMKEAIEQKIGLRPRRAKKIATFIMDMFGYELRIIDNILTTDDRQIFYMLEKQGILTTSREQNRLYDGRAWMTHYWQLNTHTIMSQSNQNKYRIFKDKIKEKTKNKPQSTIYTTLSEEKWLTRKILDHDSITSF